MFLSATSLQQAIPDNGHRGPCNEIAQYLTIFADQNPDRAIDTGHSEFLNFAIGSHRFRREAESSAIEALSSRQFSSASEAVQSLNENVAERDLFAKMAKHDVGFEYGSVFLHDARAFGRFTALNHVEGTLICSHVLLIESAADGLRLGPVLDDKTDWTCWHSGFEVIRVGNKAFPAVIKSDTSFRSMSYHVALFDPNAKVMNVENPLCKVSVQYTPRFDVAEWYVSPDIGKDLGDRLRSKLGSILISLASGSYISPPAGSEGAVSDEFLSGYDRHDLEAKDIVPFRPVGGQNPYSELAGTYTPIRLDGKEYVLGYGDAMFGWRRRIDSAFGLWLKDGKNLVPVMGGYISKRSSDPTISVE